MSCLLIGSAAMTNVRRIQHYLKSDAQPDQQAKSFLGTGKTFPMSWSSILQPSKLFLGKVRVFAVESILLILHV